ncbi:MAG: restriction endonuclease subunit S [Pirellulales bacterium]
MKEDSGTMGWTVVSLSDVARVINGDRGTNYPSRDDFVERGIAFINAGHLQDGRIDFREMNYISGEHYSRLSGGKIQRGDVLYCLRGSLGKSAIIDDEYAGAIASSLAILRTTGCVTPQFLRFFLDSPLGRLEIAKYDNGSAQPNLSAASVKSYQLPLPPLPEQRRIVAKIEELFSDLDAGVAALERAKANLKRYRASVLKAAVEGELTAEWRAKQKNLEPALKLLERILVERRQKWEADQLAKFAAAGKPPPKNWKDKYVEPVPPDTSDLPDLPEGWCWASVEQVAESVRYGSSAKTSEDTEGVVVLRMGNIVEGDLDFSSLKYLPKEHPEFPDLLLAKGDLLFNRTNSAELVGKSAVYGGQFDLCSYASYLIAVRTVTGCDSQYLSMYINSAHGRRWVKSVVSQQVGQANVNGTKLQALTFPLPPRVEQGQLVAEVAARLSQIDAAGLAIEHGLLRAARLRQSILKQAFEGKLVPQDPNDEPASALLERVKATSTSKAEPPSKRGLGKAKAAT